jgi:hypothetical protein
MKLQFFQDLLPHPQNSTVSQACNASIYEVRTANTVVSAMDVLNCTHTAVSNSTMFMLFMNMVIMAESHQDLIT